MRRIEKDNAHWFDLFEVCLFFIPESNMITELWALIQNPLSVPILYLSLCFYRFASPMSVYNYPLPWERTYSFTVDVYKWKSVYSELHWLGRRKWNATITLLMGSLALKHGLMPLRVSHPLPHLPISGCFSLDLMLLSPNSSRPQMSLRKRKPSVITTGSAIMVRRYWFTKATTITLRLLELGSTQGL